MVRWYYSRFDACDSIACQIAEAAFEVAGEHSFPKTAQRQTAERLHSRNGSASHSKSMPADPAATGFLRRWRRQCRTWQRDSMPNASIRSGQVHGPGPISGSPAYAPTAPTPWLPRSSISGNELAAWKKLLGRGECTGCRILQSGRNRWRGKRHSWYLGDRANLSR